MVAIDSSEVAVDVLSKIATEKNLPIRSMINNPSGGIPFNDSYFDAVYSHMFFNMRFTDDQSSTFSLMSKEFSRTEDLICFRSEAITMQCTKRYRSGKKYLRHKRFPDHTGVTFVNVCVQSQLSR